MTPFLLPVPKSLADNPELAPYFNLLNRVLMELTTSPGDAIASPTADVDSLKESVDAILSQLESDGTLKS